jgi:site-specific recombinase XerD
MHNMISAFNQKELLEVTLKRIDGAYAPETIRAYKGSFTNFIKYCEAENLDALPADPFTVANYVTHLSENKTHSATRRRSIEAIATIHKLNNFDTPTTHSEVRISIRKMHRSIGRYSRQANAINRDILDEMVASTDNSLWGLRDRALLLVAYDTMCRRSELVNINLKDIDTQILDRRNQISSTVIFIGKSKTDQEASGKWLPIGKLASKAVDDWIKASGIRSGKLFRGIGSDGNLSDGIHDGQVCRIYKKLARRVGLEQNFVKHVSGHSMRVGAAQDLLLTGASLPMMMVRGRWSKPDTVMRYVEKLGIPV